MSKIITFVSGDFNILHPGHLRLLKFAKESGDYLIVGINNDSETSNKGVSQDIRLESILATSYVDEAFILNTSVLDYIKKSHPNIVIKGKEHEEKENLEEKTIKEYGGKLLFYSGEIGFSSLDLIKKEFFTENNNLNHEQNFIKRHNISFNQLENIVEKFKQLNVLVIGDTIVDEYVTCEALGMSQEDPTIVVKPLVSDKFIGGAAIVASHAKTLGANVTFISVLGNDENHEFVKHGLEKLNINMNLYLDNTRPTTLKKRYRASNKTLLRVNEFKQHHITKDLEKIIIAKIKDNLEDTNLIIFSDFSYGVLTPNLIKQITEIGKKENIIMVADSQSSSQIGDISKFENMTLVTPTEREIRLSLNDFDSGLVVLSEKLIQKTKSDYILTTLGAEGLLIYNTDKNPLLTDNISALGSIIKDVSGAGDSLLTCTSMALAVGSNIWDSSYLGSIAAAIQISRVGNIPIDKSELLKELKN